MLESILDATRVRVQQLGPERDRLAAAAAQAPLPRDLAAALREPGLGVIAEVKRRSPSAGLIAPDLIPGELAAGYARGGAAAVSVLTETEHFGGNLQDLAEVRRTITVPVLRKDFILQEVQIDESRAAGADAVLLIVAALADRELSKLLQQVTRRRMTALVEAHDADEVRRAVDAGARVVGVNNRDLSTFAVDITTAERLRPLIPVGVISVAESGIHGPDDARRMAESGFDAILVGQAAAESADPAAFIGALQP